MKKKQRVVWTNKKILIISVAILIILGGLLVSMKLSTTKINTESRAAPKYLGIIYESRRECQKHCKTKCTSSGCTGERFRCITLPTPKSLPSVYPTL
ncbi:MAG: hypothetical protein WA061_05810 [Microgenomates group bacterium]